MVTSSIGVTHHLWHLGPLQVTWDFKLVQMFLNYDLLLLALAQWSVQIGPDGSIVFRIGSEGPRAVQSGPGGPERSWWSKMVHQDPEWSRVIQVGSGWSRMIRISKSAQKKNWSKMKNWSKSVQMISGQNQDWDHFGVSSLSWANSLSTFTNRGKPVESILLIAFWMLAFVTFCILKKIWLKSVSRRRL